MTELAGETLNRSRNWLTDNRRYLEAELRCLRLRLHREALWLRRRWEDDTLHRHNYQGMMVSDRQADRLLAAADRQAEARFYQEDPEAAAISRALTPAVEEAAALSQAMRAAEAPPALKIMATLFGLTPFEEQVVLLCLAPQLEPTLAHLYAYVQDDIQRKYPTPHLALTLFEGETEPGSGAAFSFGEGAPLRRFRLVTQEPGQGGATPLLARPLTMDERLTDFLQGINRLDGRITDLVRPVSPHLLTDSQRRLAERVQLSVWDRVREGTWPLVNLTGPAGVGKRAVASSLCQHLHLNLYKLEVGRLPGVGPERQELLQLLRREAILSRLAFYLEAREIDPADQNLVVAYHDVIEGLGGCLLLGSQERWHTLRETLAVPIPKADGGSRRQLWLQALSPMAHTVDGELDLVVQQFDFSPQDISQVVMAARGRARLHTGEDGSAITTEDLWQSCREQAGWHLEELAQRLTPCFTWEDIVLPSEVFHQLQEIAAQVAHRPQVYETWGFGAKLSRGRGISVLFSGPSGTGKTMAAEILAKNLNLDLFRIDLAGVVSKYIGETEKNLRKVFDAAETSGAILFFDEADALFGKRTEVKDSHDRYANIEVNYLLQRMEDYRGLAILATNRKSALDQAFLRRLRFLVEFPFPDADSRWRIWEKVFPSQADREDMDWTTLGRLEIPGGNIKNIAINAAFLAASENGPIGMAHLMRAARREYAKIEKMITETEFGAYYRVPGP